MAHHRGVTRDTIAPGLFGKARHHAKFFLAPLGFCKGQLVPERTRRLSLSGPDVHLDRPARPVGGGAETLGGVLQAELVGDESVCDCRVGAHDGGGLGEVVVVVVVPVEHGRHEGHFLEQQGVRHAHRGPEQAELEQSAAGFGGLDAEVHGLLGAHGVEGVRVGGARRPPDDTCPQGLGGGGLVGAGSIGLLTCLLYTSDAADD